MSTIGFPAPNHAGTCGGGIPRPATPAVPIGGTVGAGFAIPARPAVPAAPERFVSSAAGGVILDKDGAPAGRIPANAFVDTKDGSIYGPDGKAITLPEGASVDFFDLPDVKVLVDGAARAAALASQAERLVDSLGGGTKAPEPGSKEHTEMMKSFVDGQWGPGGVTDLKGGGTQAAGGCDMDHAGPASKAGESAAAPGKATATGSGADTTAVAGASGTGTGNATLDALNTQIANLMDQVRRITPSITAGGGPALAAAEGAGALGSIDLLRISVDDLRGAVSELNVALRRLARRGGGPGQHAIHFPGPPHKVPAPPVKQVDATSSTDATQADTTKTGEPPKTEAPKTDSSSSSDSGSDDTRAEASADTSSN